MNRMGKKRLFLEQKYSNMTRSYMKCPDNPVTVIQ